MDIDKTLVTVLGTLTGLKVHPIKKPLKATVPCIVYRRISAEDTISHNGDEHLTTDRLSIYCVHNTYSGMRTLVKLVEGKLIANNTDWSISIPTQLKLEDYDDEDNTYSSMRDYFITYNS